MLSFYDTVIISHPSPKHRLATNRAILTDLTPYIRTFYLDTRNFSFSDFLDGDLCVISTMCYMLNCSSAEEEDYFVEDFLESIDIALADRDLPSISSEERWAFSKVLYELFNHFSTRYKEASNQLAEGATWAFCGRVAGLHSFHPIQAEQYDAIH